MKHKIKLGFWAVGVFVLVLSQLLVLAPAPRAYAAPLTVDSVKEQTYKFSVYAAFHFCTTQIGAGPYRPVVENEIFSGVDGTSDKFVGFAGVDDGNNDGRVYCDQASHLWATVAGYSSYTDMLKDLGFVQTTESSGQVDESNPNPISTYWSKSSSTNIAANHDKIAKSRNIPTAVPKWGRYILAVTAMESKCSLGATNAPPYIVPVVTDNNGTIENKGYYNLALTNIAAFPEATSRGTESSCQYLATVLKDGSAGAQAFSNAMIADRIGTIVSTSTTALCERAGLSPNDSSAREWDNCLVHFNKIVKTCINAWQSSATNKAAPFDAGVIAACIAVDPGTKSYNLSQEDIESILGGAQNQATPASAVTPGEGDICDILGDEVPMKWLACAMLTTLNSVTESLYGLIQDMLYTPIDEILGSDSYTETISTFRILGMAFIFIIGLIMVIAQSTGSEIVDAYTVRKVLPKLAFAIVGIAIAVPLLKIGITFTNDIGIMAGNFITTTSPDSIVNDVKSGVDTAVGGAVVFGVIGLLTAAVALFVAGPIAITYLAAAALALLLAFLTLAIRQLLIVVLVLFAPLAIAASVLPGTDKLWKFWRTTLITSLMMFPIIMIFLKSGVFMASIFGNMGDSADNGIYYLLAAVIFIAPYFLVPLAFKMAGGLVGNIFGIINDRGKGAFDRMRKWRGNASKQRMGAFMEGNRFKGNTRMGNYINRRGQDINAFRTGEVGVNPVRWGSQLRSAQSRQDLTAAEEALQKNPHMLRLKSNDDYLTAGIRFKSDEQKRSFLIGKGYSAEQADEAIATIRSAKRSMSNEAFENASMLALPATGTYAKTEWNAQTQKFEGGKAQMYQDILQMSNGDQNRADTLLALTRQSAQGARRFDLTSGSYGDDRTRMYDFGGATKSADEVNRESIQDFIKSNGAGAISQVRGNTVKAFAQVIAEDLQAVQAAHGTDSVEFKTKLASTAGLYDTMGSASPENAEAFADIVMRAQFAGGTADVQQLIEKNRSDEDFVKMRREYQSQYAYQANQTAQAQQQGQPGQPQPGQPVGGGTP